MARYRAVAIGHTGRGNYGHDIHTSFAGIDAVELVAVADPDDAGRAAARAATGAGIYASHIVGARVALPLVDRSDPLAG